jgi:radical SAM superfamily enzyme YgiQ (UPF0313 family)
MKRNNLAMINYSFPLYRPPAEAENIILQATLGCSHNRCTYCSMYKSKRFTIRPIEEVKKEIEILSNRYPDANKVFLADGDALALPTRKVVTFTKRGISKTQPCIVVCYGADIMEQP